MKNSSNKSSLLTLMIFSLSLISCSSDPETIIETVTITETVTVTTLIPTPDTETVGSGGITFIDDSQTWSSDRVKSYYNYYGEEQRFFLYLKLVDPLV